MNRMLNGILGIFGKTEKPRQEQPYVRSVFDGIFEKPQREQLRAESVFDGIPAETEVDIIKRLLERKFGHAFQMRVKAEGYLGERMAYRLVVDDFCSDCRTPARSVSAHSVWGGETYDILDVKKEFLREYWRKVDKGVEALGKQLDKWDSDRAAEYREMSVAGSREEMLLRAAAEGLI